MDINSFDPQGRYITASESVAAELSVSKSESESAKYSKHLINRVLHGAPIIEVIFLREEQPVLALLMLSAKQGTHWYHF